MVETNIFKIEEFLRLTIDIKFPSWSCQLKSYKYYVYFHLGMEIADIINPVFTTELADVI